VHTGKVNSSLENQLTLLWANAEKTGVATIGESGAPCIWKVKCCLMTRLNNLVEASFKMFLQ
jgi:hypothetical protein